VVVVMLQACFESQSCLKICAVFLNPLVQLCGLYKG